MWKAPENDLAILAPRVSPSNEDTFKTGKAAVTLPPENERDFAGPADASRLAVTIFVGCYAGGKIDLLPTPLLEYALDPAWAPCERGVSSLLDAAILKLNGAEPNNN
jgi:hypothetical protein